MKIQFKCQQCGVKVNVPDSAVGLNSKCPQCGGITVVPPPLEQAEYVTPGASSERGMDDTAGDKVELTASELAAQTGSEAPDRERIPCPYCAESILPNARKCRFCGEFFKTFAARETIQVISIVEPSSNQEGDAFGVVPECNPLYTAPRWSFDLSSWEFPWHRVAVTLVIAILMALLLIEVYGDALGLVVLAIAFLKALLICYLAIRWGLYDYGGSPSRSPLRSPIAWGLLLLVGGRVLSLLDITLSFVWCAFRDKPKRSAFAWPARYQWLFLAACVLLFSVGASLRSEQNRFMARSLWFTIPHLASPALPPALPPKRIVNSIGMEMVRIPKGTFLMGSPVEEAGRGPDEQQHEVTIRQDFYMGAFEVTQAQYLTVMGYNPSVFQQEELARIAASASGVTADNINSDHHPVEGVPWEDAVAFCKRLSERPEEKASARVYRLPTEAEWEYACRAGSTTAFSYGNDIDALRDYGWFAGNSGRQQVKASEMPEKYIGIGCRPHRVGQKLPNGWGLYDMHGNISEWCADWIVADVGGAVQDPSSSNLAPSQIVRKQELSGRALRGGDFANKARFCRSAERSAFDERGFGATLIVGFRVVLDTSNTTK